MDRTTASDLARRAAFLISHEYALLLSGQAISSFGDAIFQTTVVLWIATQLGRNLIWAPLAVAGVFLASAGPEFIVGPLAGVYADRWNRRHTMMGADAVRAALLFLLVAIAGSAALPSLPYSLPNPALLGAIYGTVALLTSAGWFFVPSRIAFMAEVVPDEYRERASGLAQTSAALATILGPAAAAPLFVAVGAGWALVIDGLSFVVSFTAITVAKDRPSVRRVEAGAKGRLGRELAEGARIILQTPVLRMMLVAGALISVGLGTLETLSIFFLRLNLHAATSFFGLFGGAEGVGTLVGAAVSGFLAERLGARRVLWQAAILLGCLYLLLSRLTALAPAVAVIFLMGAVFALMEVAEGPLLMRSTPREALGRVSALLFPAFALASAVASLLAGWLASTLLSGLRVSLPGTTIGPVDAVIGLAGIFIVLAGLYARQTLSALPGRPEAAQEPEAGAREAIEA